MTTSPGSNISQIQKNGTSESVNYVSKDADMVLK